MIFTASNDDLDKHGSLKKNPSDLSAHGFFIDKNEL